MNNSFAVSRIAFTTIINKEVTRFMRIWSQTLLPPAITMTLYFFLFGRLVGSQLNLIHGYTYMQFIAPGLIMMAVITNAYGNVVASFFSLRFQKSIEELLISPTPNWVILTGYMGGGILRGILVGILVAAIALCFTHLKFQHPGIMAIAIIFTAAFFSLAGFTNALFAKRFDDISIIPNFVLTPLTYLGGVFYTIDQLPAKWHMIAKLNPILYMVNVFRYGLLGISDVSVVVALNIIFFGTVFLFVLNLYFLNKGVGLKS